MEKSTVRSNDQMSLFRPPVVRSAAGVLDRALFSKTIPISAARLLNNKIISKCRSQLTKSKEILVEDRIAPIRSDPDPEFAAKGGKCLLLNPRVKHDDPTTWSPILQEAVKAQELGVIPFDLTLNYDHWNYIDIMKSILPEDAQGEIPVGFAIVGHVAHLNLHDEYLPYKNLVASVLMDKNPTIRTVINKIDDVGTVSEYRTFSYEVLAGDDEMNVEIREGDCTFRFDYSKVYWNSRLQTEHKRLVDLFEPGDVVCDVMAGVGPFALPAGKKGVFVWANDLNPDSYKAMKDAVVRNKVENFVRTFNEDGHKFIPKAADDLLHLASTNQNIVTIAPKRPSRSAPTPTQPSPPPKTITIPNTISHFVMNLPATAIDFLPAFHGLYHTSQDLFTPHTEVKLPMVHVHCFAPKNEDNEAANIEICERVSEKLGVKIVQGDEHETKVWDVRDVAPKKRMFCVSFRIPAEVAFGQRRG
ncbi:b6d52a30-d5b0-40bd-9ac4-54a4088d854b [Sclerotinia trifoliorum]|uniref:tRNA (guanine(37)-N1)-methyltransferase n=1 Tax=Sclerotinia trifoliorum TaxID=28548 RepID=A0A8H2VRP4_9HELO|nr:b6d52a30-d5b0-40bd-9ac4-54a4088d854b [Sclerotinia trifoliorum]